MPPQLNVLRGREAASNNKGKRDWAPPSFRSRLHWQQQRRPEPFHVLLLLCRHPVSGGGERRRQDRVATIGDGGGSGLDKTSSIGAHSSWLNSIQTTPPPLRRKFPGKACVFFTPAAWRPGPSRPKPSRARGTYDPFVSSDPRHSAAPQSVLSSIATTEVKGNGGNHSGDRPGGWTDRTGPVDRSHELIAARYRQAEGDARQHPRNTLSDTRDTLRWVPVR